MATYKTPGVYVEEISLMPPSIAEVETAIPAFIGFTEKNPNPEDNLNRPVRITSFLEYQANFGSAQVEDSAGIKVNVTDDEVILEIATESKSNNVMFYAMQLYFANGGGPCYVSSAGAFANNPAGGKVQKDPYLAALKAIEKEDEPTLLVFPDAPFSLSQGDYYDLMNPAIQQCTKLQDRFTIVDVFQVDTTDPLASIKAFRGTEDTPGISGSEAVNLKYAAAYFPYLNTSITHKYDDTTIVVATGEALADLQKDAKELKTIADQARRDLDAANTELTANPEDNAKKRAAAVAKTKFDKADKESKDAQTKLENAEKDNNKTLNNYLQNQVKLKLNQLGVTLTPCAAIAGVYASVDNARGVWKSPANVSLNYVKSTTVKITDDVQDIMNIDVIDGKSVNAIRPFPGKGIKVWGARTLTGNDNEWRYISVRRFFNMVEESIKKSTYWAVFEPNDKNTWTKVRAMIENYLILKWKDGALAGAKPDDAFFVRVGLGQTMSPLDVLEGRMIVEIGLAVVRPAEFIILKFSHKMQTT